ncbi:MAG: methionyl-tRNA formyltransferase [Patescibacteria group bacterium]
MSELNYVFFGTSRFASIILSKLLQANLKPALVITVAGKPTGRSQNIKSSAVLELAQKHKLAIKEVINLKKDELISELKALNCSVGVLAALGKIVPLDLLNSFPKGIVNVHPSLLPKYRGPSPIQTALLKGDQETGITLMMLDKEVDHGPIIDQQTVSINNNETNIELEQRLAELSGNLLIKALPDYIAGKIEPKEQDHSQASFCAMIQRDDGKVNWSKSAKKIYNQWRSFTPWPGIFTTWQGKRLKLIKINLTNNQSSEPGLVIVDNNSLQIGCADYFLQITELQLEGGKQLAAGDFLKGHANINKSQLPS